MSFTNAIFRNSVFFFVLLFLSAVWGFWMTYFTGRIRPIFGYDHFHGIAMFGWILMLIIQSTLIRSGRRDIHRQVGKFSYVLAPWIFVSTILLANHRLNDTGLTDLQVYILSLQVFTVLQFVVFYALAMKNRRTPDVHARFMVCTALPMIDPIFARVLVFNLGAMDFTSRVQLVTYGFADLILVVLVVRDWISHQRRDVFLPALVIMLVTQAPVFLATDTAMWHAFAAWFMSLPLT